MSDREKAPDFIFVVYTRIPRLSRPVFERGILRIETIFQDVVVTPKARDQWYEGLISFPDYVFEGVCQYWTSHMRHFPSCQDLGELCFKAFPQREFEIDAEATITKRRKLEELERRSKAGDFDNLTEEDLLGDV